MGRFMCWLFGHQIKFMHPQQDFCFCKRCKQIFERE